MSVQALTAYILAGLVHARVIKGHAAGLNEAVGSDGLGPLISAIFSSRCCSGRASLEGSPT
jgi:hypothetical protein